LQWPRAGCTASGLVIAAYADPDGKPCRVGDVNGRTIRIVRAPDDENFVITVIIQN
jgi:hypothetical protein